MYSIVDDSEVTEDESMETTTTANETPEVRAVIVNSTFHKQNINNIYHLKVTRWAYLILSPFLI